MRVWQRTTEKITGVLNNSEPYVKLDEDAYIIMPKGAQFSDASYKKTESAKGKRKLQGLHTHMPVMRSAVWI